MTTNAVVLDLLPSQPHTRLGALVRRRYKEQGLSMGALAERASVSRSTVHRIVNAENVDITPEPPNIAQVLVALGIDEDEVRATIDDDDFRRQVLLWMGSEKANTMRDYARARSGMAISQSSADLVLISPAGVAGRIAFDVKGAQRDEAIRQVADVLGEAGWVVARPVSAE